MLTPKRELPSGERSLSAGRKTGLVLDVRGEPWMGPGTPPEPTRGADPRSWEYPMWVNVGEPRSAKARETGGIDFLSFRALAEQVHVRAAIETVKNAQCKREWTFTLTRLPGERATDVSARSDNDPRIAELTRFFTSPDWNLDLAEWLRKGLEDLLVLDAWAVYGYRGQGGKPIRLEVFDGATIRPLLDETGRPPMLPVVETDAQGRKVIRQPYAYQQYLYGQPGSQFTRDEMLYAVRNPRPGKAFGCSPVEQLCLYINIAIRKDMARLNTYTEGNIPAGLLPMPSEWKSSDITQWFNSFNSFMKGVAENQIKIVPIPGGTGTPIFPSLEANKDMWEESWIRLVAFAFDIPVTALVREVNRSVAETNRDSAEQDGQAAYTDFVRRKLNWIVRNWFGYDDIVVVAKQERDVDPEVQAAIDQIYLASGKVQIAELRERDGQSPLQSLEGREGFVGPTGFVDFGSMMIPMGGDEPEDVSLVDVAPVNVAPTIAADEPVGNLILNGAQLAAASAIVTSVAAGLQPRDSGLGQLRILFRLSSEEAEAVMGSAGTSTPTTPNPNPAKEVPIAAPVAAAEKSAGPHAFSSTEIVLPQDIADRMSALAAMIPDEALTGDGREDHFHVTVKYGVDPKVTAGELADLLSGESAGTMTLGRTTYFAGDEHDVVYVEVESSDLVRLNKRIRDGVETTDTYPEYIPHVTLAYVESGRGAEFSGVDVMEGTVVSFSAITFRHANGSSHPIPLGEAKKASSKKKRKSHSPSPDSSGSARGY